MDMYVPRIDRIVEAFINGDEAVRNDAEDGLQTLVDIGMTRAHGAFALRAATREMPPEYAAQLLAAVADSPDPEFVPVVAELFSLYPPDGQEEALWLLAHIGTADSIALYLQILAERAATKPVPGAWLEPLDAMLPDPQRIIPAVLAFPIDPPDAGWRLCRRYAMHDTLDPSWLAAHADAMRALYADIRGPLIEAQRPDDADREWVWADEYLNLRGPAATYLDLMGYLNSIDFEDELSEACVLADPVVAGYAVLSIIRRGGSVADDQIARAAADPEMRKWIVAELDRLGHGPRVPEAYRTQAALAESDLVNLLADPTEIGRAPQAIELMDVIGFPTDSAGETMDYYLFRFRDERMDDDFDGWMAGWAGPFLHNGPPEVEGDGTGTEYVAWDDLPPDEHLPDPDEMLEIWRGRDEDE
jgi:hypothetical protein